MDGEGDDAEGSEKLTPLQGLNSVCAPGGVSIHKGPQGRGERGRKEMRRGEEEER